MFERKEINGRVHFIAKNGYVMTDGNSLYSRHLILEDGAKEPNLHTITGEEYEAMLEQCLRSSRR
jgi:hypothetical protein